MVLAAADVEAAYRAVLKGLTEAGGRVVTSGLNRDRPEQTSGSIQFEVPTPQEGPLTVVRGG